MDAIGRREERDESGQIILASHGASISPSEVNVLLMRYLREIKRRMQTATQILAEVLFHVKVRQQRFDKNNAGLLDAINQKRRLQN
jgi:hypothetical protein